MDSTIIAALVSAGASIVVAFISKTSSHSAATGPRNPPIPKRNQRVWIIGVSLLLACTIFAALFLHWDLAGSSAIVITVVIWVLAAGFPIRPAMAAAAVLLLFPFAFAAEPIGKWRRGLMFDNHFEADVLGAYVGFAFGVALITWLIAWWRSKSLIKTATDTPSTLTFGSLPKDLSELAELYRTGALTENEFVRAKEKLLAK